jgi:hypothetical protein
VSLIFPRYLQYCLNHLKHLHQDKEFLSLFFVSKLLHVLSVVALGVLWFPGACDVTLLSASLETVHAVISHSEVESSAVLVRLILVQFLAGAEYLLLSLVVSHLACKVNTYD